MENSMDTDTLKKKVQKQNPLLMTSTALALAACGGGGGSVVSDTEISNTEGVDTETGSSSTNSDYTQSGIHPTCAPLCGTFYDGSTLSRAIELTDAPFVGQISNPTSPFHSGDWFVYRPLDNGYTKKSDEHEASILLDAEQSWLLEFESADEENTHVITFYLSPDAAMTEFSFTVTDEAKIILPFPKRYIGSGDEFFFNVDTSNDTEEYEIQVTLIDIDAEREFNDKFLASLEPAFDEVTVQELSNGKPMFGRISDQPVSNHVTGKRYYRDDVDVYEFTAEDNSSTIYFLPWIDTYTVQVVEKSTMELISRTDIGVTGYVNQGFAEVFPIEIDLETETGAEYYVIISSSGYYGQRDYFVMYENTPNSNPAPLQMTLANSDTSVVEVIGSGLDMVALDGLGHSEIIM